MANQGSVFKAKRATSQTNPTSATVFKQADNSALAANILIPGDSRLQGQKFRVRASGRVTGGTTTNFTPRIQYSSAANGSGAATSANNTAVAAATARAFNTLSGTWSIEGDFIWDSTSAKLNGAFWALNGSTATLDALAATTAVSTVDLSVSGVGFVVDALFSATNASNTCTLDDFSLEVL